MKFQDAQITAKALLQQGLSVLVSGPPGIGKSALAATIASQLGWRLVTSQPVVNDPVDYKGLPFLKNGRAEFLPFADLLDLIETREDTLWFIDDLIQAPTAVQAALMQLVHPECRHLNGKRISDKVRILACTNRRQDRAGGVGFIEPLKQRFVSFALETDHVEWTAWALGQGLSPYIAAYLRWRPAHLLIEQPSPDLSGSANPRNWVWCSKVLAAGLPADALHEVLIGVLGQAVGSEFANFLNLADTLPDLSQISTSPHTVPVPVDPTLLYAVVGSLLGWAAKLSANNLFQYLGRLPEEFQVLFVTFASSKQAPICNTSEFADWTIRNQQALG